MLEAIGDFIKKLHLPARYLDEVVHASINLPTEWLEKRGLSRKEQSFALSMATYFSIVLPFFKDAFVNAINPYISKNNTSDENFIFNEFPLLAANMTDTTLEATRRVAATENGAISSDLYTLVLTAARPYILTAASLGIYFGWDENPQMTRLSLEIMPWILSMYTRDSHTRGLLQETRNKIKEFFYLTTPFPSK